MVTPVRNSILKLNRDRMGTVTQENRTNNPSRPRRVDRYRSAPKWACDLQSLADPVPAHRRCNQQPMARNIDRLSYILEGLERPATSLHSNVQAFEDIGKTRSEEH